MKRCCASVACVCDFASAGSLLGPVRATAGCTFRVSAPAQSRRASVRRCVWRDTEVQCVVPAHDGALYTMSYHKVSRVAHRPPLLISTWVRLLTRHRSACLVLGDDYDGRS
jgi:hypothetical protein